MQPGLNITTFGELTNPAADNRLVLRFIERTLAKPQPDRKAYDFHSLVWEVRIGATWAEKVAITREDFDRGAPRRWVSALHSFDTATGKAIIKVGELQPRDAAGKSQVEYTWREWDLAHNRQVRMIKVCAEPFEPLESKGGG